MNKGVTEFLCFDHGEDEWHVELRACSGCFSASQDFYTHAEDLHQLGRQLADFTGEIGRETRFELGDRSGRYAYFLLLRAYSCDLLGHSALEYAVSNFSQPPYHREASFSLDLRQKS